GQERVDGLDDLGWLLIRHELRRGFGARLRGDDRLAAFALVTAREAVDLKRRPGGALFVRREAAFAEQFRHAEKFPKLLAVERQARELFALERCERNNVVVKAGHGDAALCVVDPGQQLREGERRILDRAAEDAGVQIA